MDELHVLVVKVFVYIVIAAQIAMVNAHYPRGHKQVAA
jgi:hypothetical protein